MASIVNGNQVVMAEHTVQKIMLLNKLWIPDVLIDIIKDYLYINRETVLRNYFKASINSSIERLRISYTNTFDQYGRTRLIHWAIGHYDWWKRDSIQLQDVVCAVCGECESRHTNNEDGCCAMEWDGTLALTDDGEVSEEEEFEEEDWDW